MFSSKFLYFILFLIFIDANAQNNEPINSDRPDQSEGTYILTKNSFQIENGLLLQDKEMINNLMIRYGLTKKTEFRIVSDFGLKNFDDDINTIINDLELDDDAKLSFPEMIDIVNFITAN